MFRKTVKVKSNHQLKGSERKLFKLKIHRTFPNLTENDFENLFPKKESIASIKLTTASEEVVYVYTVQKCAMAFEVRNRLFPTVFFLWKFHNLIPSLTTHRKVIEALGSGADLMLPGVITPPATSGLSKYGNLNEGAAVYINTNENRAAIAVGVAAMSSAMMAIANGGKCVLVYHMYGDKLCRLEEGAPNNGLPRLGPPQWLSFSDEDFPPLGSSKLTVDDTQTFIKMDVESSTDIGNIRNDKIARDIEEDLQPSSEEILDNDTTGDMDQLLNYCFFGAVKYSKTLTLPILTSNFYKMQIIPLCPEGKNLDLKKSSFKKLKPFLDYMSKEGIITIKEVKKGVESITAINRDHPKFTEFYIEPSLRPKKEEEANTTSSTRVAESYIITQNVLPIFESSGLKKGDSVEITRIRQYVTEYVKKNDCQNESNKRLVKPKGAFTNICKTENLITWEELMEKVCNSMKTCCKVTTATEESVIRGPIAPVVMTVAQRSGNKKVTLVDNLEFWGIRLSEFAKDVQHGIAASTSIITKPPGKKYDQLLVQGNQTIFLNNILTSKHKIPQRYIKGLENAPKKKK